MILSEPQKYNKKISMIIFLKIYSGVIMIMIGVMTGVNPFSSINLHSMLNHKIIANGILINLTSKNLTKRNEKWISNLRKTKRNLVMPAFNMMFERTSTLAKK